jgi:hypothetical protein
MDLEDLRLPPQTDEEKQRWHENFKKMERENREKEIELASLKFEQTQKILALQQQNHKEMLIGIQVEAARRIEAEKQKNNVINWSGDIEPLEPLTKEQRQDNCKRAAWTWVDAIYILQGYKPVYQLSTEQVRSHFPQQVHDFTQSIQLGNIGKEIIQAGERTYIDTPANWEAFWQNINKTAPEPQSETLGDAGAGSRTQDERQSQLYIFIWRVHQFLSEQKKPTAQQVWREIQKNYAKYDTDKIIQEVDGNQILWCSGYGNEQKLQRGSFDKTLSTIRKNPPFKNIYQ